MKTTRIYGRPRKISEDYLEVPYTEYRDGKKHSVGTEDFSRERWNAHVNSVNYEVRKVNGRQNRAGQNMTDCLDIIHRFAAKENRIAAQAIMRGELKARYGADVILRAW